MKQVDMAGFQERRSGWQFDKTINMPTVLSIAAMALAMFSWGSKTDSRLTALETSELARKESMAAQIASQAARDAEQRQDFRELRARMDALKDAVSKKN